MSDPYAVLGVGRDADGPTIHTAYRRAVRRTHPDAGGTAAEFEAVQEAYETLRDPVRRAAHEARTRSGAPRRPGSEAPGRAGPEAPGREGTQQPGSPRPVPEPQAGSDAGFESMDDLLADSRRLENEARRMAGLPPRDFGDSGGRTASADSFAAILDDAQRQLRGTAGALARELRRRARRML